MFSLPAFSSELCSPSSSIPSASRSFFSTSAVFFDRCCLQRTYRSGGHVSYPITSWTAIRKDPNSPFPNENSTGDPAQEAQRDQRPRRPRRSFVAVQTPHGPAQETLKDAVPDGELSERNDIFTVSRIVKARGREFICMDTRDRSRERSSTKRPCAYPSREDDTTSGISQTLVVDTSTWLVACPSRPGSIGS